jgi:D-glycero-alpha-D-manno-heptose-7-phosphate kinase
MRARTFDGGLFEHVLRRSYSPNELVRTVDEVEHNVIRDCLKRPGFTGDIERHAVANPPAFTGLGSMSAFTVALLHVLHVRRLAPGSQMIFAS